MISGINNPIFVFDFDLSKNESTNVFDDIFSQLSVKSEVEQIFERKTWFEDLKNHVSSNREFVEILRSHFKSFKSNVARKLENLGPSEKWDSRIVFLNELYAICLDGGDERVLTDVIEDRHIAELLPPLFSLSKSKKEKKIHTLPELFQNAIKMVSWVEKEWDSVVSEVQKSGLLKISQKTSSFPRSLYFIRFFQKIFICVKEKGDPIGSGTYKIFHSYAPIWGSSHFAIAKGVPHNITEHNQYSLESWKEEVHRAFLKDSEIARELHDKGVPSIPRIKTVLDGEKIRNVMIKQKVLKDFFKTSEDVYARVNFVLKTAQVLAEMHKHELCHLDLKSKNILVNEKEAEMQPIDFGSTRKIGTEIKGVISTYPAPENVETYLNCENYIANARADLWPLGNILCQARYNISPLDKFDLSLSATLEKEQSLNYWEKMYLADSNKKGVKNQERVEALNKLRKIRDTRKQLFDSGQLYSQKLVLLKHFLVEQFGDSDDELDQCIISLLSVDPKQRPSAKEVQEIISSWINN